MVKNLWNSNDSDVETGLGERVYRSNLIGQDRSVANWGGGNTSTKTIEKDFKGNDAEVMWVKGSGSDLATMKAEKFTGLNLGDMRSSREKEDMSDEEMGVKGSGSDLATMKAENFTRLNLEDIRPIMEKEDMSDEEMVNYLGHCMIDSSHPRSSIETLLHAFLPYKHVDHTHPDAIISI